MIKTILLLRLKQFRRLLEELGVIHLIVFLFVLFPMVLGAWMRLEEGADWWMLAIMGFLLFSIHINRKDKAFLKLVTKSAPLVFIAEYLLISIPGLLWVLNLGNLWVLLGLVAIIVGLPFINWTLVWKGNQRPLFRFPTHFMEEVEWISGVRKSIGYLLVLYVLGVVFCWWSPAIVLVVLFILGIIVATFYMEAEHDLLLPLYSETPQSFIRKKIKRALGLFWAYSSPLVGLFFIFHYEYWYVFLIVAVIASLFPVMGILLKYGTYAPGTSLKRNELILGIMIAFMTLPFGQPVPILLSIRYYKRSMTNLKHYFDD